MKRDFLLDLSSGFIYDCLNWGLARLGQSGQRQAAVKHFSGVVCIDELYLGRVHLAAGHRPHRRPDHRSPSGDDQRPSRHMRCFVRTLQYWGFEPKVVVTGDGSNPYPAVLAELWPTAKHQLCVFHVLQDVLEPGTGSGPQAASAGQANRGKGGRKRRRGRGAQGGARQRRRRSDEQGEGALVYWHWFLIVKRYAKMTPREWEHRRTMLQYLPELFPLCHFLRGDLPPVRRRPGSADGTAAADAVAEECRVRRKYRSWCKPWGC